MRPERRRRGDVLAAVLLALLLVGGVSALVLTSAAGRTVARPAAAPIEAPPPAGGVPSGFTEAWRAPSAATPAPVVAGSAVVTGDGGEVVGRTALTGAPSWSYARDRTLCTVAAAFPGVDSGAGRVLALYPSATGWCSELTALRPDTGTRAAARNPDARPGTRLLAAGGSAVTTGPDYLEVVRSDLVETLQYGAVTTPAQPDRQPRTGCTYGSTALTSGRLGVLERCPGEATDRLTVLATDPTEDADQPQEEFSVPLPAAGATLVALSADRAAVALPGPPRLQVLDSTGAQLGLFPLDVPDADLAADPPGGLAAVTTDSDRISWWTGSRTVGIATADLAPLWTVPATLGPALPYGGALFLPVPAGLLEVDAATGIAVRTLPVDRTDPAAPVRLAAAGEVLLEQRGPELVALRPTA